MGGTVAFFFFLFVSISMYWFIALIGIVLKGAKQFLEFSLFHFDGITAKICHKLTWHIEAS